MQLSGWLMQMHGHRHPWQIRALRRHNVSTICISADNKIEYRYVIFEMCYTSLWMILQALHREFEFVQWQLLCIKIWSDRRCHFDRFEFMKNLDFSLAIFSLDISIEIFQWDFHWDWTFAEQFRKMRISKWNTVWCHNEMSILSKHAQSC